MNQQPQYQPPRRTGTFSSQHDEAHTPPGIASHQGHPGHSGHHAHQAHQGHQSQQISPRDYSTSAPHIKLDQVSPNLSQMPGYQSSGSVPNALQPGVSSRQPTIPSNAGPTIPSMQQSEYPSHHAQTPPKHGSLSLSHSYSRSSPSAHYEAGGPGYLPYTPTTPGGTATSSQFMSPTEPKYAPSGSQRNISNTPLGLADIRPRADSSLSDGLPGTPGYELASTQSRTSNYMAPWALYAFDWCKWTPHANSGGKLAIGSYLEDGHNFVSAS